MESFGLEEKEKLKPFASEAAWRLGRWDELEALVTPESESGSLPPDDLFQIHLGRTMLNLHKCSEQNVARSIRDARMAVMESLSSAGRESYSRAYDHIVRLQVLSELEDCTPILCGPRTEKMLTDLSSVTYLWERRLVPVSTKSVPAIMNSRLAVTRLAGDKALEGTLFVSSGTRARRSGALNIAQSAFAQAQSVMDSMKRTERPGQLKYTLHMELARLKYEAGENAAALRMLGQGNLEVLLDDDEEERRRKAVARAVSIVEPDSQLEVLSETRTEETQLVNFFVVTALQSTQWMMDGGLKGAGEMMSRFRTINKIAPDFEQGKCSRETTRFL